jgi:hypothetical protein
MPDNGKNKNYKTYKQKYYFSAENSKGNKDKNKSTAPSPTPIWKYNTHRFTLDYSIKICNHYGRSTNSYGA